MRRKKNHILKAFERALTRVEVQLPIWTLPSTCRRRDQILVVYMEIKEITRDGVKSKLALGEFDW